MHYRPSAYILLSVFLGACTSSQSESSGYVNNSTYQDNYVPGISDLQVATDLALNSLYPASGPVEGGTAVDLIGSGFTEDIAVYIGGQLCHNLIYRSQYRATVTTPPGTFGPALVKVVSGENYAALADGFSYYDTVKINSISADKIPAAGGTSLTIKGQGFISGTIIKLGSGVCQITNFPSAEEITVTTPALPAGAYRLTASNINGTAELAQDIILFDNPAIYSLEPPMGPLTGGTQVTISGAGLIDGTSFWLADQPVTGHTTDQLGTRVTFTTPAASQEGQVTLKAANHWGEASLEAAFVYYDDANSDSRLLAIQPPVGPAAAGNTVDLIGYHLPAAGAKVYFGPQLASCQVVSQERYRCQPPAAADGQVDVKIISENNEMLLPLGYRYVDLAISGVSPADGSIAGGELVTISGRGLTADTLVTFNGNGAAFVQWLSSEQLVVRLPAGQAGPATVAVSRYNISDRLEEAFTYYNNANKVDWISGGRINGTVNGFVYDSWYGQPLKNAYLLIGSDVEKGLGAFTDANGMVTISSPGLRGPLPIITASKPGYSNQSYLMVDGRDMIFWLVPAPEDTSQDSTDEPPPEDDSDNSDRGNNSDDDQQTKPVVYPTVYGSVTRVKSSTMDLGKTVWVFPTNSYVDGSPYVQKNCLLQYEGDYSATVRVGDVAMVALAGDYDDKGNFIAKNMGMSPFQSFDYDRSYQVDILIDTPLDTPMTINFVNASLDETTPTTSTLVNMDLGALGYLPFPRRMGDSNTEVYYLPEKLPHDLGEMKVHLRCGVYGPNLSTPLSEVRLGLVDHTKPVNVEPLLGVLVMEKPQKGAYFNEDYEFIFRPNNNPPPYPTFNQFYFIDGVTGRTSWLVFGRGDTTTFTLPKYDGRSFGSPFGANSQTVITQSYYVPELSFDDMDDYRVNDWLSRSYNYDYFTGEKPENTDQDGNQAQNQ